jgi:hypothetical protein
MTKLREMKTSVSGSLKRFKKEHKIVFWIILAIAILASVFSGLLGGALIILIFIVSPYIYYRLIKWGIPPIFKKIDNGLQRLFKVNKQ